MDIIYPARRRRLPQLIAQTALHREPVITGNKGKNETVLVASLLEEYVIAIKIDGLRKT